MEEKNKGHMLEGFFDRCREMYTDDSNKEIGRNPLEQIQDKKKSNKQLSAEAKLKKIKRIILE